MRPFFNMILFLSLLACGLGLSSCQKQGNSQNSDNNAGQMAVLERIPKLLDRSEPLWNGKEWEKVQNAYGTERAKLLKDPNAKEPWLNLAEIFMQEARVTGEHPHYYPAAMQALEELMSKPFDEKDKRDMDLKFRGLSDKASVQLSLHDFANALQTGKEAVQLNPYNAAVYGVLVDANVELGHYEEAVKMADKMVEIRPDLRSYSRVSYLREIYGDVDGAIEAMKMAAEAGFPGAENTAWTTVTLGGLCKKYGKTAEAEQVFRAAEAERENYPFAMAGLAEIEIGKKNYSKAEEWLKKAIDIIPEVGFYESLAQLYSATGRQAEFDHTVAKIVEMMKEDEAHGHNMDLEFCHVYSELANDQPKALEYCQKEYGRRPDNIDVNGAMALVYLKMGDRIKADFHLAKALRTGSKKPEWLAAKQLGSLVGSGKE